MTPEERTDLIEKITAKLAELDDLELMRIATQHDIHVPSYVEKMAADGKEITIPPIIDTSAITGPLDGLKNFLIKKQRDNDSKS